MKRLALVALLAVGMAGCGGGGGSSSGGGAGSPIIPEANAQTLSTTTIDVVTEVFSQKVTATDTDGVQSVSCPVNTTVISAECHCKIPDTGPLFSLTTAGNSAVCGCSVGIGPTEPITVSAQCMSKTVARALSGATIQKPMSGNLPDEAAIAAWGEEIQAAERQLHEARQTRR